MSKIITVAEYAKIKGVSVQTVYNQIKGGVLKTFKTSLNGKDTTVVEFEGDSTPEEESFKEGFKAFEDDFKDVLNALKEENKDLRRQLEEKDAIIASKDEVIADYSRRFADLAAQAQTIAAQAQTLQAAEKKLLPENADPDAENQPKRNIFHRLFKRH